MEINRQTWTKNDYVVMRELFIFLCKARRDKWITVEIAAVLSSLSKDTARKAMSKLLLNGLLVLRMGYGSQPDQYRLPINVVRAFQRERENTNE